MRAIPHNFAPGDEVVYKEPYRRGHRVGKITAIGKMYATINGARIHIPKVKAKMLPGKDAKMLVRLLDGADDTYTRACNLAASAREKAKRGLYAHYCEGKPK